MWTHGDHYNEESVNDHHRVIVSGQIGQQLLLLQQLSWAQVVAGEMFLPRPPPRSSHNIIWMVNIKGVKEVGGLLVGLWAAARHSTQIYSFLEPL